MEPLDTTKVQQALGFFLNNSITNKFSRYKEVISRYNALYISL